MSTVGYIAPSGMYVSLTQSNADEDKLVRSIHADWYPTGCPGRRGCEVDRLRGGSSDGGEPVWTTHLDGPDGGTQIAITGRG